MCTAYRKDFTLLTEQVQGEIGISIHFNNQRTLTINDLNKVSTLLFLRFSYLLSISISPSVGVGEIRLSGPEVKAPLLE